jgi:hypothetical protein
VIDIVIGGLASRPQEGLMRAIRADMTPIDTGGRDVMVGAGENVGERLRKMGTLPVGGAFITPGGDLLQRGAGVRAVSRAGASERTPQGE